MLQKNSYATQINYGIWNVEVIIHKEINKNITQLRSRGRVQGQEQRLETAMQQLLA
jgi:hypothetical protein